MTENPAGTAAPCPQGRTDYEACFAPFRYCPVKGCGRAEATPGPCCGDNQCTCCQATGEHEHVAPRAWRLTEAEMARSGPWVDVPMPAGKLPSTIEVDGKTYYWTTADVSARTLTFCDWKPEPAAVAS